MRSIFKVRGGEADYVDIEVDVLVPECGGIVPICVMLQCNSSRFAINLERGRTVVLRYSVGFEALFSWGVGSEWNDFAGTRQAEEPDLLAEFTRQGGEEGEGLGGHRVRDMCT